MTCSASEGTLVGNDVEDDEVHKQFAKRRREVLYVCVYRRTLGCMKSLEVRCEGRRPV